MAIHLTRFVFEIFRRKKFKLLEILQEMIEKNISVT